MVSPKHTMINNCTFRKSGDFAATLRGVVEDFYAGSRSLRRFYDDFARSCR